MKHEMTIDYLKCGADLNFKVDFKIINAICMIVTKWDVVLFEKWIVFIHNTFFSNPTNLLLMCSLICTMSQVYKGTSLL